MYRQIIILRERNKTSYYTICTINLFYFLTKKGGGVKKKLVGGQLFILR